MKNKGKILVVDDEESILRLVSYNLEREGYEVLTAADGNKALAIIEAEKPDLVILDLMLPGMDGIDICRHLRLARNHVPIIMLTARDDEIDKVLGLQLGADDYVTKPFSPKELMARVYSVLRRYRLKSEADQEQCLTVGDLVVYPERFQASLKGCRLDLTPKEFELLTYLVQNRGRVLSRDQLLDALWGYTFVGDTRIIDVHISHLREKLQEDHKSPRFIKTIHGVGYKFEGEES
ncbi:MAG: response regulator transcription factor [Firmicutes bacterium]|nr:response regulator transcription factor [Bacillota bacterium]